MVFDSSFGPDVVMGFLVAVVARFVGGGGFYRLFLVVGVGFFIFFYFFAAAVVGFVGSFLLWYGGLYLDWWQW